MGFTESCSGDDEVYMLMIVLALRSTLLGFFFVFFFNIYDILIIANSDAVCVEVFSWSLMSPSDCLLVFLVSTCFLCQFTGNSDLICSQV